MNRPGDASRSRSQDPDSDSSPGRSCRVACLGGGTGQAQVIRGLAQFPVRIASIVGVTDNGGHSGFLRRTLDIPPVGDLRNCLSALGRDGVWTGLMRCRFRRGPLDGTSAGNLVLAALTISQGSLSRASAAVSRLLRIPHQVLPVSDSATDIAAELADGTILRGEWQIVLRRPRLPIVRVFHRPPIRALPGCLRALRRADLIVVCPGALLTSIFSCLLASGIRETLRSARGRIAQVGNIMTMPGVTDDMDAFAHLARLAAFLGRRPDYFLLNTARPSPAALATYRALGGRLVRDDLPRMPGIEVVRGDFLWRERDGEEDRGGKGLYRSLPHNIRHDPRKIGKALYRLARCSRASLK